MRFVSFVVPCLACVSCSRRVQTATSRGSRTNLHRAQSGAQAIPSSRAPPAVSSSLFALHSASGFQGAGHRRGTSMDSTSIAHVPAFTFQRPARLPFIQAFRNLRGNNMLFVHAGAGTRISALTSSAAAILRRRSSSCSPPVRSPRASVHASSGNSKVAPLDASFEQRREALKRCLAREYTSFFRPFEEEFYSQEVTFKDPLNNLRGRTNYKANVEMLSGDSIVGNILFSDGFIDLHAVEDVPGEPTRLRTRWTLGFTFKLLPWKPQALFTGVSEYTIDSSSALVLSQRDYWDTLSLQEGGSYLPEKGSAGVVELVEQLLPDLFKPAAAREPAAAAANSWKLLRRAQAYRVYQADDGMVFAVPAPGYGGGLEGVEAALRENDLIPKDRVLIDNENTIQLQSPNPWQA